MKKSVLFICLMLWGVAAQATNGFFANGVGTKSKGMAGAGVALAQDALSGGLNPANLAWLETRMDVGGMLLIVDTGFTAEESGSTTGGTVPPGEHHSNMDLFLIPQFAYNHRLDEKSTVGVVTVLNGLSTEYDAALFSSFDTGATDPSGVDFYQAMIHVPYSRKITEKLALGVAPILGIQAMRFRGFESFESISAHTEDLSNNGFDFAFGLGVSGGLNYRVNDRLSLGLGVQSQVNMTKFHDYQGILAEEGNLDVPEAFQVGVAFQATPRLTLAADYQRIYYSNVTTIANSTTTAELGSDDGMSVGWEDARVAKFGVQWQYDQDTVLRAGYSHCNQITPDEHGPFSLVAPAVGTNHFSIGLTKQLNNGHEFSVSLTHAPEKELDGTNSLDSDQADTLEMEQTELEITYGWRF
uniref:Long-chain fatty acid transport protein n=1 Tax=Candidatus Kentrum eta TaxID=2126337 RepID=A0A450UE68_9GAMM|nr:MAG: long-chain fatty acid transport protein [Candidatus Kentron sp. H]VFJ91880.1 MAG: long-chain fatty acid transport protein [Candidatus Kentron sp. H]VFJ98537.1 MAG: long-chain fatty acid transport protein [Candidatus Kentron sp. H]